MTDAPKTPAPSTPDSSKSRRSARFAVIRRRSVWIIFITAAVLLLLRVALIFIFPAVLEHVLAYYNLTAGYRDIKLNVLGGDAEIWGLKVRPLKGGPDVMTAEYCTVNISVYKLFVGQLYIRRPWRMGRMYLYGARPTGVVRCSTRFCPIPPAPPLRLLITVEIKPRSASRLPCAWRPFALSTCNCML